MDKVNGGVPDEGPDGGLPEEVPYSTSGSHQDDPTGEGFHSSPFEPDGGYREDQFEEYSEEVPLPRQLAQFAFVREEDEREVRLTFRDVPAHEIARAFRGSGALLISMMGERALSSPSATAQAPAGEAATGANPQEAHVSKRRARRGQHGWAAADDMTGITRPNRYTGELTMRYFFSLNDLVYTINIVTPTGIVDSIAGIYPAAALSEHELQSRLAVVFRGTGRS